MCCSSFKTLLVFASVSAGLSLTAEGFVGKLAGGWKREYDAVEGAIGELDNLIPSLSGEEVKLFEQIKVNMQSWDGSSALCEFEEAKQIGEWTRAVNKLASSVYSDKQVYKLTKCWLENRIAQCAEQFVEKYRDRLRSIDSAARLGVMVRNTKHGLKYNYGLWYSFFYPYFDVEQSKCLANMKLFNFGVKAKARKYFDQVNEEKIVKVCEIVKQMEDATSFAVAIKSITSLPKAYQMSIKYFTAAKVGCEEVDRVGKEFIWKETSKGFKEAAEVERFVMELVKYGNPPTASTF